ncbi:MAG: GNAT family N-acetyltransferase [Gammaproteobacteria bacterium]|nr:GNAT family N-acetyltransferase [Gammaproteobacteria bacterium]
MGRFSKERVHPNSEARLRAISWRDWDALTRLSRTVFPEISLRQLSHLFINRSNIVVLEVDSAAAGYCFIYNRSLGKCWLDWLVVDSRYHSCGYGSLLLKTVEGIAVARECRTIQLAVLRDNPATISFYKHHGFAQYGEEKLKLHFQKSLDSITPYLPVWLPAHSPNRLLRVWYQLLFWIVVRNIKSTT